MSRPADVLEVLLPRATPAEAERARRVTTFLRLLAADARPAPAGRVRVDLERARSVFEQESDRSCISLLLDLLRQHLEVAVGSDSFCWTGAVRVEAPQAWSALELLRDEWPWLPQVPGPGERALAVCERLLEGLERFEGHAPRAALWRARLARAAQGPGYAVDRFREILTGLAPGDARGSLALAGLVECQLDAGAVRRARADLADHGDRVGESPRLQRLRAWVELLCDGPVARTGDGTRARTRARTGDGLSPSAALALAGEGPLPRALAELRERRKDWLEHLPGGTSRTRLEGGGTDGLAAGLASAEVSGETSSPGQVTALDSAREAPARGALGAAFLGVLALDPGGGVRVLHADLAPALEARLEGWLVERDGACSQPSEPEHRLVIEARSVVIHRAAGQRLRGALFSDGACAQAFEPILDGEGEVAGWLHLEFEHHLVPTAHRLRLAAAAHAARWWPGPRVAEPPGAPGAGVYGSGAPSPHRAPDVDVFRAAIAELGLKLTQRRWWGFAVRGNAVERVTDGGGGLAGAARRGGGRAVERALRCGGLVRFDEPNAQLSIHADAASGVCVPLFCRGRLCGALALESSRRRDFGEGLMRRLEQGAVGLGTALRTAEFRAWHAEHFGHDVHFAPSGLVDELVLVGRARAPVAVLGSAGCGKRVIARWVHFESERWRGPLISHACGVEESPEFPAARLLELAAGGTLVLHDVERLPESCQVRLAALLACPQPPGSHAPARAGEPEDPASARPRILVTSNRTLVESVAAGKLRADLARRLERLTLCVPPLAEHRDQIPGLVAQLVERFAREEAVPEPRVDDAALACLWRQPWPGNVRQLENVVFKLVLTAAGARVGSHEAEAAVRASTGECLRRVPSRRPDRALVLAALELTRTGRGSLNKTRASLFLGWDPDTLVLRMGELDLQGPRPASASPSTADSTETSEGAAD